MNVVIHVMGTESPYLYRHPVSMICGCHYVDFCAHVVRSSFKQRNWQPLFVAYNSKCLKDE